MRRLQRARNIRRLAQRIGFHYLSSALPRPLHLSNLPQFATSVANVIDSERGGRRVIAFDCRFVQGRTRWCRTVIAIRSERSRITVSAFNPDIELEQIDDWTFLYRPRELAFTARQLMPVAELTAYLDAI